MKSEPNKADKKRKLSDLSGTPETDLVNEQLEAERVLKERNQHLADEVNQLRIKLNDMTERDKELESQIWDLRKLIKRVAMEGYAQIQDLEREKENIQKTLEDNKESHRIFKQSITHLVKISLYWHEFILNE